MRLIRSLTFTSALCSVLRSECVKSLRSSWRSQPGKLLLSALLASDDDEDDEDEDKDDEDEVDSSAARTALVSRLRSARKR